MTGLGIGALLLGGALCGSATVAFLVNEGVPVALAIVVGVVYGVLWPVLATFLLLAFIANHLIPEEQHGSI